MSSAIATLRWEGNMTDRRIIILTMALLVSWRAVVRAEPRIVMPDNPAGKDARDAAAAFFAKIAQGDARGAKEQFAGEADQLELVNAYVDWVSSYETLAKQVKDRFGETDPRKGVPPIGPLMQSYAERQLEKFMVLNGDRASIAADDKLFDEGMELRQINGVWKVTHLNCDHRSKGLEKVLQAYAAAARSVSQDLQAKRFSSIEEAMSALSTQSKKAEEMMRKRGFDAPRELPATPAVKWAAPDSEVLAKYWGKTLFSPEFKKLVSTMPGMPHLFILPESLRLTAEDAGITLVFDSNGGLKLILLYGEGIEGFRQYPGALPKGLAFGETRKNVEAALGRPNESSSGRYGYSATYPQLGFAFDYAKESPRDPENSVAEVRLLPPRKDLNAAKVKRPVFPRLAFRLVVTDPAIAADEMADPIGDKTMRVSREVLLDETSIAKVQATYPTPGSNDFAVAIEFSDQGAQKMKEISKANVNHRLAIILDGEVLMAPNIQSEIGKNIQITMAKDAKNTEASTLAGRMHAAVFTLQEGAAKK